MLENTLWNRQLGVMSEEIVAALVCQIFEGGALCACTMTWEPEIMHAQRRLQSSHPVAACGAARNPSSY